MIIGVHLIASALWVGGVFMNTFIVWPTARDVLGGKGFPLDFLAMEGKRIAPWLYTAAAIIVTSGFMLLWLRPPEHRWEWWLISAKILAFLVMTANTLYGTLVTWPVLQFSTPDEAWRLWRGYGIRAFVTFGCGIAAFLMGVMLRQ